MAERCISTFWMANSEAPAAQDPPSKGEWQQAYPDFRQFSDAEVAALIARLDPAYAALYRAIRIPACRSDVARLFLLYEYGGLYLDAHAGTADRGALDALFDRLDRYELILFDNHFQHQGADDFQPMNSAMLARAKSPLLLELIRRVGRNLLAHYQQEARTPGYVPYNIFVLSGAWDMSLAFFDRGLTPPAPRASRSPWCSSRPRTAAPR